MNRFEPALCTVTFRNLPVADVAALAGEAGLKAIEWAGDAHVPPGDLRAAAAARRLSEASGLALSYGSYVAPPDDDLAHFVRALDTAEALGATNIRIWPGTRDRDSADYAADEARVVALAIRGMGEEAARRGISVSLEYHPGSLTDSTESATRLIETVAHGNVYLYWQPRPGLPLGEALAEIGRVGEHVSHVHVFAWDRGRNRFALSTAAGFWRRALAAFPDSRWKGRRYAMLEFVAGDDPEAFRADAATLKGILAES